MIDRDSMRKVVELTDLGQTMKGMTFNEMIASFDFSILEAGESKEFLDKMIQQSKELIGLLPDGKRVEFERFINSVESGDYIAVLKKMHENIDSITVEEFIAIASSVGLSFSIVRSMPSKEVLFEMTEVFRQIASGIDFEKLETGQLVALAETDKHARQACERIVAMALSSDQLPPSALRHYMVHKIVDGESPLRQGRKSDARARDGLIYLLCRMTMEVFDFPLEKNVASEGHSVSSIVAEIAGSSGENLSPSAVRKIYTKMDKALGSPRTGTLLSAMMSELMH